ncbi:MAG: hypothetical protein E7212_05175 [Clostridium sartagoforme]|nr:hypothetical protein [Clostridium sartagoforme]
MKTKLEVVSGFLGSGKTSFINAYLNTDVCLNKDILIILLERGITNIKSDLKHIKVMYIEESEKLKVLLLKEIKKKEYSKVIIEFNGTDNLRLIGDIFKDKELRKKINFYGSYFVGNSKNLKVYLKNLGEIIIPFIQSSKLIVLNNFSLLDINEQKDLIKYIEEINPNSPIISSKFLDTLDSEIKLSKYFKESIAIKRLKSLIYKEGVS